jgi:hypothetical protein
MSNATDCGKVLAYCDEHGSITAREAFIHLNINSHRKVISYLRRKGFVVRAEPMPNNGKKPYNRYFIEGCEA